MHASEIDNFSTEMENTVHICIIPVQKRKITVQKCNQTVQKRSMTVHK